LIYRINEEVTSYLTKGTLAMPENRQVQEARERPKTDLSKLRTSRSEVPQSEEAARAKAAAEGVSQRQQVTVKRQEAKVGRNDPCPCGSGKKYKHCHGR
ncbi:MAG: hypothetical protein D6816_13920, partial [Bacteroidetes bacterium]